MQYSLLFYRYSTNYDNLFVDDFSSDEDDADDDDDENIKSPRCKALYQYSAKLNDELSLEPGKSNFHRFGLPVFAD